MIDILKPHVKQLVEDINGNHVIQKSLTTFIAPYNNFIFDEMIKECREISCHKHGCCVMQKCIDGATKSQQKTLIAEIISHTQEFVRNAYGNYVVQFVLDKKDVSINSEIGKQLLGSLIELGKQKFSSNVIEKCLELNSREVKNAMVEEMLQAESYLDFLTDQYGNYVIQKTLQVAEEPAKTELLSKIKLDMYQLKNGSDFAVKIYGKLVKSYPCLSIDGSTSAKKLKPKSSKLKPGSSYKKKKSPKRKYEGQDDQMYS